MVFLVACAMHIMIDLLPKLEKRAVGAESADGGCQFAHSGNPSEDTQNWAKQRARSMAEAGWPNKHTLRILQDFSSEPNSNLSSRSLEKATAAAEGADHALQRKKPLNIRDDTAGDRKSLIGSGSRTVVPVAGVSSRLLALFEHPLYRIDLPPLTDDDTLLNVNTDIRFYHRAAGTQGW